MDYSQPDSLSMGTQARKELKWVATSTPGILGPWQMFASLHLLLWQADSSSSCHRKPFGVQTYIFTDLLDSSQELDSTSRTTGY